MNEKLLPYLKEYFGYKDGEHSVFDKYVELLPEERLKKAKEYLKWGESGQRNAMSDFTYYAYGNDQAMAGMMIQVFQYALKHEIKMPLPDPYKNKELYWEHEMVYLNNPKANGVRKERWVSGRAVWLHMIFEYMNQPEVEKPWESKWISMLRRKTDYFNGFEFEIG